MDNFKFKDIIRYILPGLIFVLEYIFFTLLIDASSIESFYKSYISRNPFFSLSVLLVFFFFLGYMFSTIYHVVAHICRYVDCRYVAKFILDHRCVITDAINKKYINVEKNITTPADAWIFVTAYWNANLDRGNVSNVVMSADKRTQVLADWVHSAGAVMFANFAVMYFLAYNYGICSENMLFYQFFL